MSQPIDDEAIERLRDLGEDAEGESVLRLVIAAFRKEAELWQSELRAWLAAEELGTLQRAAHTLRGSAAALGASRLAEVCGELEILAADGRIQDCKIQLPPFEEALSDVLAALARIGQSLAPARSRR